MTIPSIDIDINDAGVRKWRKIRLGISDYGAAGVTIPATNDKLFKTTGEPIAWPTGVKDMGYITTDGLDFGNEISSTPTNMLQSVRPVRDDLESVTDSLTVTFGEENAWVEALKHYLPVSSWPATRDQSWGFDGEEITDMPYYVLWILAQDGVGAQAVFRHELKLKARPTARTNSVMNASDPETSGFTFGIYVDEATDLTHLKAQDGPAYTTHVGTVSAV